MASTRGHELAAQIGEGRPQRGGRHAGVSEADQRVGDVLGAGEEIGELAAVVEGLLQIGLNDAEVVGGAGARPRIVTGGFVRLEVTDKLQRHLDHTLVFAARDADEAGVVGVVGQGVGVGLQGIEQAAHLRIHKLLAPEGRQKRQLPPARGGASGGHVGHLVPTEERCRGVEVVDLHQPAAELGQVCLWRGHLRGGDHTWAYRCDAAGGQRGATASQQHRAQELPSRHRIVPFHGYSGMRVNCHGVALLHSSVR